MGWNVGIARLDITPIRGTYLAGYGNPRRAAVGVLDRTSVTAFCLRSGDRRLVVLGADLLSIHEDTNEQIRARISAALGVPPDHVWFACSHSHSTPTASATPKASRAQHAYVRMVVERAVEAARQAAADERPATLRYAAGVCNISVNRRVDATPGHAEFGENEHGPCDRDLHVLRAERSGAPDALLITYACHPIVLSPKNRHASADWVGAMRSHLEQEHDALVLFAQGGTADVNPRHDWGPNDAEMRLRFGAEAAAAVGKVLASKMPALRSRVLKAASVSVPLPLTVDKDRAGVPLGYQRALAARIGVPAFLADPLLRRMYPWRPRAYELDGHSYVDMEAQAIRIGEIAICTHASEAFALTSLRIRENAPADRAIFAGYSNGMVGYVPPAHELRRGGYESDMACYFYRYPGPFERGAEERAVEASIELMRELF